MLKMLNTSLYHFFAESYPSGMVVITARNSSVAPLF
jgi:hypothetical protein